MLACVGDDPESSSGGTPDAASNADTSPPDTNVGLGPGNDAATEDANASPCDLTKPFGAPAFVPGVNTAEDDSAPSLTADEETIYFTRANGPDVDIYVATRSDRNAAFDMAQPVPGVNLTGFDGDPFVTYDGKLFFMSSVRTAAGTLGGADIFFASRDPNTGVIGSPAVVPGLSSSSNDGQPYLAPSGGEIFFSSARADASAPLALYRGLFGSGSASDVSAIAELNTPFSQGNPVMSADGTTIYFATTRIDGVPASSGNNIWSATRTQTGSFGTPAPVEALNSDKNEYPKWISPDGCRLYLQSDRPGIGKYDIYVAERPKK